jgi:hypothetical protein
MELKSKQSPNNLAYSLAGSDSSAWLPTTDTQRVVNFETEMAVDQDHIPDFSLSGPKASRYGSAKHSWSMAEGMNYSSSHSPSRAYTSPLIYPGDSINDLVAASRDKARDLLQSGVSLHAVTGSGPTDVELLFRTRQPDEAWNVPGWACEVGLIGYKMVHMTDIDLL